LFTSLPLLAHLAA